MMPQEREEEQSTQGFTVSDKRLFTREGQRRAVENEGEASRASAPPPPPRQEAPRPQQAPPRPQASGARPSRQEVPPTDFSSLVLMLAQNVTMFLGQHPDPAMQQRYRDLSQAKHMIDILIMLREKTKGNLNIEEQQLLEEVVSQLQMAYVTVSRQGG
jgi:Domain of unknown function (DUF1844)